MDSAHKALGWWEIKNKVPSCAFCFKPPSNWWEQGRMPSPAHVISALICPKKRAEMTLASYYVGRLSHELSLVSGKGSLDQHEKDILYSRLAIPLISEAAASQNISGNLCLDLPIFAFTMFRKSWTQNYWCKINRSEPNLSKQECFCLLHNQNEQYLKFFFKKMLSFWSFLACYLSNS